MTRPKRLCADKVNVNFLKGFLTCKKIQKIKNIGFVYKSPPINSKFKHQIGVHLWFCRSIVKTVPTSIGNWIPLLLRLCCLLCGKSVGVILLIEQGWEANLLILGNLIKDN
jgi:hypothetical protein